MFPVWTLFVCQPIRAPRTKLVHRNALMSTGHFRKCRGGGRCQWKSAHSGNVPKLYYYFTCSNQYTLQQSQWRTARGHLVFRAYNAIHHTLSTADIGRFLLAIVELRCNDVGHSPSTFSRVIFFFFIRYDRDWCWHGWSLQTYWMEAICLRPLSTQETFDEDLMQKVIEDL